MINQGLIIEANATATVIIITIPITNKPIGDKSHDVIIGSISIILYYYNKLFLFIITP